MWRLKVQSQRFLQILQRFFFCLSLASHIDIDALSYIPFTFPPDTGSEFPFHKSFFSLCFIA